MSVEVKLPAVQLPMPASVGQRTDTRSTGPCHASKSNCYTNCSCPRLPHELREPNCYKTGNANAVTWPCRLAFPAWPIWASTVRGVPCHWFATMDRHAALAMTSKRCIGCFRLASAAYGLASAACVIADSVPRVVMTSGSSITSISVPSGRARAASNSGSNSSVRPMRTPA